MMHWHLLKVEVRKCSLKPEVPYYCRNCIARNNRSLDAYDREIEHARRKIRERDRYDDKPHEKYPKARPRFADSLKCTRLHIHCSNESIAQCDNGDVRDRVLSDDCIAGKHTDNRSREKHRGSTKEY